MEADARRSHGQACAGVNRRHRIDAPPSRSAGKQHPGAAPSQLLYRPVAVAARDGTPSVDSARAVTSPTPVRTVRQFVPASSVRARPDDVPATTTAPRTARSFTWGQGCPGRGTRRSGAPACSWNAPAGRPPPLRGRANGVANRARFAYAQRESAVVPDGCASGRRPRHGGPLRSGSRNSPRASPWRA